MTVKAHIKNGHQYSNLVLSQRTHSPKEFVEFVEELMLPDTVLRTADDEKNAKQSEKLYSHISQILPERTNYKKHGEDMVHADSVQIRLGGGKKGLDAIKEPSYQVNKQRAGLATKSFAMARIQKNIDANLKKCAKKAKK
jgi:hypothetical protein